MLSNLRLWPVWQSAHLILRFILAFSAVAVTLSLILRAISPSPDMLTLSPKLAHYQMHAADYDTVFIGTSRTLYHIIPAKLDEGARAAGCSSLKAFNFGVQALNGSETDWLVSEVLRAGDGHIKRIVLDRPLPEARDVTQVTSERARYLHGPSHYGSILEGIWTLPEINPKRVFRTGIFAIGVGYDLSGVGRASMAVFPGPDPDAPFELNLAEHGFEALDEVTSPGIVIRREEFLTGGDEFDSLVTSYDPSLSVPNLEDRVDYILKRLNRLEDDGIRSAFFIAPNPRELVREPFLGKRLAEKSPGSSILNYNQPDIYPHFFDRSVWQDFSHFSRKGAEQFSIQVGRDLCEQAGWGAG